MKRRRQPLSPRHYALTVAASWFLLFLALVAVTFTFLQTFSLSVSPGYLLALCALAALGAALIYSVPRGGLCVGLVFVACGLMALLAWWRWTDFANGAQVLFHQVSFGFHEEIPSILFYELPRRLSRSYQQQCVRLFLAVAVPALGLWLGPWLSLNWPVWPAVGAVAGAVAVPLFILRQPQPLTLLILLAFLSLVILSRRGYRESAVTGARRVFAAALPVALTVSVLWAVIPPTANPRPQWVEDVRLAIQDLPTGELSIGVGGTQERTPGEQDFASAGPLNFDGHTVLQVRSNTKERQLLLRGFSAGKYGRRGWTELDSSYPLENAAAGSAPLYYPGYTQGGTVDPNSIRITDLASTSRYYYTPYFPVTLPQDVTFHADSYLTRPDGADDYSLSFLPASAVSFATVASGDQAYWEGRYRAWVYENYLDVPYDLLGEEAQDFIRQFAEGGSVREADGDVGLPLPGGGSAVWHSPAADLNDGQADYLAAAHAVADLLASFTEYDQSTPATPAGEDFVSHFLTSSRRGYCVHYASAATLILRAMGIPARYTAGYVARIGRPNAVVNVPDRNAHAWVEIYIDGFGWQPVDVTPGFSGGGTLEDLNDIFATPSPSPSPSAAPATPSPTPPPSSPSPSPSAPPAAAPVRLGVPPAALWALAVLGVLALGALGAYLSARLRRERLRKRCADPHPNRAAIAQYAYLVRLERRAGIPVPRQAADLAQKAYFSQHTLTGPERAAMEALTRAAADQAKALPLGRRLLLRYVYALL